MKKLFVIFTGLIFVLALALPFNALADDAPAMAKVEQSGDAPDKAKDEGSPEKKDASAEGDTQDTEKKEITEEAEEAKAAE